MQHVRISYLLVTSELKQTVELTLLHAGRPVGRVPRLWFVDVKSSSC